MSAVCSTTPLNRKLRTSQAAEYVGLAESTLNKLRLTGDGPLFMKLGRVVVYDLCDLEAWCAARKVASTSELTSE